MTNLEASVAQERERFEHQTHLLARLEKLVVQLQARLDGDADELERTKAAYEEARDLLWSLDQNSTILNTPGVFEYFRGYCPRCGSRRGEGNCDGICLPKEENWRST